MGCGASTPKPAPAPVTAPPPAVEDPELVELKTLRWNALKETTDTPIVRALHQGTIRLVSIQYLLNQKDTWRIPRCQELREIEGALLPPSDAAVISSWEPPGPDGPTPPAILNGEGSSSNCTLRRF